MRNYFYYEQSDNTMIEYQKLKELYDIPIAVRTGTQRSGIGRADHIWLSPPGGLWFSFDIHLPYSLPSFALYTGACLHKGLIRLFSSLQGHLSLKWTNDLMYDQQKLGGILCRYNQRNSLYQIGMGINTNNSIDPELGKFGAVALKDILGFKIDNEWLCRLLINEIERHLREGGNELSFLTYCNDNLFGKGRWAVVEMGGLKTPAEILGIDTSGALLIRKKMGEYNRVHTGSILYFLDPANPEEA